MACYLLKYVYSKGDGMKTVIVDYGMGNLRSVLNSVREAERLAGTGTEIVLSACPEDVAAADKIIFPGQGAMPDCMAALQRSGLGEAVSDGLKTSRFSVFASGRNFCSNAVKKGILRDWVGLQGRSNGSPRMCATTMEAV